MTMHRFPTRHHSTPLPAYDGSSQGARWVVHLLEIVSEAHPSVASCNCNNTMHPPPSPPSSIHAQPSCMLLGGDGGGLCSQTPRTDPKSQQRMFPNKWHLSSTLIEAADLPAPSARHVTITINTHSLSPNSSPPHRAQLIAAKNAAARNHIVLHPRPSSHPAVLHWLSWSGQDRSVRSHNSTQSQLPVGSLDSKRLQPTKARCSAVADG
jgi:hypothetical protein